MSNKVDDQALARYTQTSISESIMSSTFPSTRTHPCVSEQEEVKRPSPSISNSNQDEKILFKGKVHT